MFPKLGHESAEGCEAPHESLNVLDVLDWGHLGNGRDLVGVRFDAALGDDVPQEIPTTLHPREMGKLEVPVPLKVVSSSSVDSSRIVCSDDNPV
jgi:hypothetical protein